MPQTPDAAISRRAVRAHFGRAARSYSAAAVLQHQVEDQLLEGLDAAKTLPEWIVDVGCGPGRALPALRKQFPAAQILALDWALPMLQQIPEALTQSKRWGVLPNRAMVHRVVGDAAALPLPDASVDLLFSSLCIQWCLDLPTLFAQWQRVLRPGGLVLFSSFGPDTLQELRQAWAGIDSGAHVNHFYDMHDIGDAMLRAGFSNPVLSTERFVLSYDRPRAVIDELKHIGATNAMSARKAGLGGRAALQAMLENYPLNAEGRAEASFEVVFAQAYAPAEARRRASDEIASVPVSAIKRRVR